MLEVDFQKQDSFALGNTPALHLRLLQLAQFEHSKLNLPMLKKKISSSYNTKLLKSQIDNNYEPCS